MPVFFDKTWSVLSNAVPVVLFFFGVCAAFVITGSAIPNWMGVVLQAFLVIIYALLLGLNIAMVATLAWAAVVRPKPTPDGETSGIWVFIHTDTTEAMWRRNRWFNAFMVGLWGMLLVIMVPRLLWPAKGVFWDYAGPGMLLFAGALVIWMGLAYFFICDKDEEDSDEEDEKEAAKNNPKSTDGGHSVGMRGSFGGGTGC